MINWPSLYCDPICPRIHARPEIVRRLEKESNSTLATVLKLVDALGFHLEFLANHSPEQDSEGPKVRMPIDYPPGTLPVNIQANAIITFLTTDEGGRRSSAPSRMYRPQVHFGGQSRDAMFIFKSVETAPPGSTVEVQLSFLYPETRELLSEGMKFQIREGNRIVGSGTITKVIG